MKLSKIFLLVSATMLSAVYSFGQTADEVISKSMDAVGGKDKISKIKSIYTESTAQIMGNDAPVTVTILNGKGFKSETEFNGSKIIQALNDKGGWMINPMAGSSTAQALPDEQYKAARDQIFVGGELFNYAANGSKAELLGKEGDLYKIKITGKDSSFTTYFIDPATYYLKKAVKQGDMMGQPVEITISFSDYQKTDFGYVIPHKIDTDMGGNFSFSATVNKVEINKEVDPKIFEMPK
ncbi:MAG: outer rane lipoproteinsorting protein [Chitinophagaceae bacterium]|nr:outer rane lipoproteinsorting protein [Chitinophagaceae bacterium]